MGVRLTAALVAGLTLGTSARAQVIPVTDEFPVNTVTAGQQEASDVAIDGSGSFMIVWHDSSVPPLSVLARQYAGDGSPLTPDFVVNEPAITMQVRPTVAANAAGDYLVTWLSVPAVPMGDYDIVGRRFDSSGSPVGPQFTVGSGVIGTQAGAIAADGRFLVAWNDLDTQRIHARGYDSAGAPIGADFIASTGVDQADQNVVAAVDGSGNYVLAWTYASWEIRGVRIDPSGTLIGSQFTVNEDPNGPDIVDEVGTPTVAAAADGSFAIAWRLVVNYDEESVHLVQMRLYDSAGVARGPQVTLAEQAHETSPQPYAPSVAAGSGELIATWLVDSEPGRSIDAQRFTLEGQPKGPAFNLVFNPIDIDNPTDFATLPSCAANADSLIVAWDSARLEGPMFDFDVRARLFRTRQSSPICTGGEIISGLQVKLSKLDATPGDEKLKLKGAIPFGLGTPAIFSPSTQGAQILIEDLGAGDAPLFELSHRTLAIPSGVGCGPDDGWKVNGDLTSQSYRNASDALPAGCAVGSANGLQSLKFKDRRGKDGTITVKAKGKGATIGTPVGPLRVSIVPGGSAAAGSGGECGVTEFPADRCQLKGKTYSCR